GRARFARRPAPRATAIGVDGVLIGERRMSEGGEAREGTTCFHLFTYGTLRRGVGAADTLLRRCERVGGAAVPGTLYDIDGRFPALVLAGTHRVEGDVWRCPADVLPDLDRYEGVAHGLF